VILLSFFVYYKSETQCSFLLLLILALAMVLLFNWGSVIASKTLGGMPHIFPLICEAFFLPQFQFGNPPAFSAFFQNRSLPPLFPQLGLPRPPHTFIRHWSLFLLHFLRVAFVLSSAKTQSPLTLFIFCTPQNF